MNCNEYLFNIQFDSIKQFISTSSHTAYLVSGTTYQAWKIFEILMFFISLGLTKQVYTANLLT